MSHCPPFWMMFIRGQNTTTTLACIASGSMQIQSKKQATRVKDHTKNGASKRVRMGWGKMVRKHLQTNPGILKTALLACYAQVRTLPFDAVISCHKLTTKMFGLPWSRSDFSMKCVEPK